MKDCDRHSQMVECKLDRWKIVIDIYKCENTFFLWLQASRDNWRWRLDKTLKKRKEKEIRISTSRLLRRFVNEENEMMTKYPVLFKIKSSTYFFELKRTKWSQNSHYYLKNEITLDCPWLLLT